MQRDHVVVVGGAGVAVFIFDLHHDQRTAPAHLQVAHLPVDLLDVAPAPLDILRIGGADFHIGIFRGPPRNAAVFDLGAAIRSRAQDRPQAVLAAEFQDVADIGQSGKRKLAFLRLNRVPEQIEADRVQTHCLGLLEARVPVLRLHAAEVHLAREEQCGLAVDEELLVARLELVRPAVGDDGRDGRPVRGPNNGGLGGEDRGANARGQANQTGGADQRHGGGVSGEKEQLSGGDKKEKDKSRRAAISSPDARAGGGTGLGQVSASSADWLSAATDSASSGMGKSRTKSANWMSSKRPSWCSTMAVRDSTQSPEFR